MIDWQIFFSVLAALVVWSAPQFILDAVHGYRDSRQKRLDSAINDYRELHRSRRRNMAP